MAGDADINAGECGRVVDAAADHRDGLAAVLPVMAATGTACRGRAERSLKQRSPLKGALDTLFLHV